MKNRTLILCLIIVFSVISGSSFSQSREGQKNIIKPALLVIDVQNAYVSGMAQKDKDVAMLNINYYISLFRAYGHPVIRIYHYSKKFGPEQGTELFEFPSSNRKTHGCSRHESMQTVTPISSVKLYTVLQAKDSICFATHCCFQILA